LEVDGGVKVDNAASVVEAGADVLVAGSAIFCSTDYAGTIKAMREASHAMTGVRQGRGTVSR
jgi:ribulose-phosphate 3-epimerase